MRSIVLVISVLFSLSAWADEPVLLAEKTVEFHRSQVFVSVGYSYNKKKDKAEVWLRGERNEFCRPQYDPCWPNTELLYIEVPEIYFDENVGRRGGLVVDGPFGAVVCATKNFLPGFKETGACPIIVDELILGLKYRIRVWAELGE